jgi:hypothetical protein
MFVMGCLCFLPLRVEGMMARELIRVKSDSFEAVLLSWRGRKLLSRQLSRMKGCLLCFGVLGSVATRLLPRGLWLPIQLALNVKAYYLNTCAMVRNTRLIRLSGVACWNG